MLNFFRERPAIVFKAKKDLIMLYELNLDTPSESTRVPIKIPTKINVLEKHIEDFMAANLVELLPEEKLMLLAQERKRQEEADILALDRNGTLFIFELKRWKSTAENLLQVLRYGQKFGRYSYKKLESLAHKQQRLDSSLQEAHREYFELNEPLDEGDFNKDQRFVVVTNGTDHDTLDAVKYWSNKGIGIDSVTYKLYQIEGKPFIQFDTYSPDMEVIAESNPGFFIVNTNKSYTKNAWQSMLGDGRTGKASAFYGRKHAVKRIEKGSTVFLYHTGVGVIACGKALDSYGKTEYNGEKDAEYYVPLAFSWALNDPGTWKLNALKANQINAATGASHRFRQTVFNASQEMCDAIEQLRAERA